MANIEFSTLDAMNRADVDAWMALLDAGTLADMPDFPLGVPATRIVELVRGSTANRIEHVLAKRDGVVVGTAELIMPLMDNERMLEFELEVHPDHCRTGVGTALLAEVERRAAEHGRSTLIIYVSTPMENGPARPEAGRIFAQANGFTAGLDEVHSVADLTTVPQTELDAILAAAWEKAEGYELVQWVKRAPDDVIGGVAYLEGRMNLDAPAGDLDVEQEVYDADRMRGMESRRIVRGQLSVNTGVRHKGSGALAGWTDIVVNPGEEEHAWQGTTIVDPDHRGHRLGTILKAANHRLVRTYRPRMRYVHTWNAENNDQMLTINQALGYRPVDRWVAFQKKL